MTTSVLTHSSPFQIMFHTPPNYSKLRSFGCLCYLWTQPYGNNKFTPRSVPCVFLGYSLTQSAFICLDVLNSRVYISRHLVIHETIYPSHLFLKFSLTHMTLFTDSSTISSCVSIFSQSITDSLVPKLVESSLVSDT